MPQTEQAAACEVGMAHLVEGCIDGENGLAKVLL